MYTVSFDRHVLTYSALLEECWVAVGYEKSKDYGTIDIQVSK